MKNLSKILILIIFTISLSVSYAQIKLIQYEDYDTGDWNIQLLDTVSNKIIAPLKNEYDFFLDYKEEHQLILISKNNKLGVYSFDGKEIVEPIYKSARLLKDGFIRVVTFNNKFGLYNKKGKLIINTEYDYIGRFSSGMVRVGNNIEEIYLEELEYTYESYEEYQDINSYEYEDIEVGGGKWGFIDKKGKIRIPLQYSYVNSFKNGSAYVCVDGYYSFGGCEYGSFDLIDLSNKSILPENTKIYSGNNNDRYIIKSSNKKYGVVDANGKIILDALFSNLSIEEDKYIVCELENNNEIREKIYNYNGKLLFDNNVTSFGIISIDDENGHYTNYLRYKENEKWGLADSTGVKITEAIYHAIEKNWTFEGLLLVSTKTENSKNTHSGLIDFKGNIILPLIYDNILSEYVYNNEITFLASKESYIGAVNKKNETVIPFQYQELKYIEDYYGPASFLAKKDDKFGFIYLNNKVFIDFKYETIFYSYSIDEIFANNRIKVSVDGKEGIINNSGNYIIQPKFKAIINFNENWNRNMIAFKSQKSMGIIDTLGHIIVDPIYTNIYIYSDSIINCTYKEEHLINVHTNKKQIFEEIETYGFSYEDSTGNYQTAYLSKINDLYGYISIQSGETIIPFIYEEILDKNFDCRISIVLKDGKYGMIDKKGNEILKAEYEFIKMRDCDYNSSYIHYVFVKKGDMWGVFDEEGKGKYNDNFIFSTYEEAKKKFPYE